MKNSKLAVRWNPIIVFCIGTVVGALTAVSLPRLFTTYYIEPNIPVVVSGITPITQSKAEELIRKTPTVQLFLAKNPNALVDSLGLNKEKNGWEFQVFDSPNGHSFTHGWYRVDATDGEVIEYNIDP
jgi:hypothetical protein